MQIVKKLPLFVLAVLLAAQVFAGCSPREEASDSASSASSTASAGSARPGKPADGDTVASITPDFTKNVSQAFEENDHTIGWLQVPGTNIEDVVLCKPDDKTNNYYFRLGFDRQYSFNGVFWADYSTVVGDGTRGELGVNTCIYGHAIVDDIHDERYDIKFGNLHEFRDPDFAKTHPYINFSTAAEDMVFEIIAVFVANSDNLGLPYNHNSEDPAGFVKMIREDIFPRSKYLYDVELTDKDKFLTLSTCIYTLDNGTVTGYPDTYYRYAVMARLVDPDEPVKTEAVFEMNEDVLYDPDGKWPNQ